MMITTDRIDDGARIQRLLAVSRWLPYGPRKRDGERGTGLVVHYHTGRRDSGQDATDARLPERD